MEKRENLFWFCRIENETNFSDWTQKWHYVSQLKSNEQYVQLTHLPAGKYESLLSNIDTQRIDVSNNEHIPVPSIASVLF